MSTRNIKISTGECQVTMATDAVAVVSAELKNNEIIVPKYIADRVFSNMSTINGRWCLIGRVGAITESNLYRYVKIKSMLRPSGDKRVRVSASLAMTLGLDADEMGDVVTLYNANPKDHKVLLAESYVMM